MSSNVKTTKLNEESVVGDVECKSLSEVDGQSKSTWTIGEENEDEELVSCYFRYEGSALDQVLLVGSFDNWESKTPLTREADVFGRGEFWEITVDLLPGRHEFLFLVDGEYKFNPNIVSSLDEWGNTNNYIDVKHPDGDECGITRRSSTNAADVSVSTSPPPVCEVITPLEHSPHARNVPIHHSASGRSMSAPPHPLTRRPSMSPKAAQVIKPKPSWVSRQQRAAQRWHSLNPGAPDVTADGECYSGTEDDQSMSMSNFQLRQRSQLRSEWELETVEKLQSMRRSQSVVSITSHGQPSGHQHSNITDKSHERSLAVARLQGMSSTGKGATQIPVVEGAVSSQSGEARKLPRTHLHSSKTLLVLVGLPARGKTYIAGTIQRHLTWQGQRVGLVNVGNYRRKIFGSEQGCGFFDPSNSQGSAAREEAASAALNDALNILVDQHDLVIYDATNTTKLRRKSIRDTVEKRNNERGENTECFFLEIICNDESIIRSNLRETKLFSPDYVSMNPDDAINDFLKRIEFYKQVYEPVEDGDEGDTSYLKLIDVGRQIIANRLSSVGLQILPLVANLHITPRPIYLVRHGESVDNTQQRIGGDSSLSALGLQFAGLLGQFMNDTFADVETRVPVWTSTLLRTHQSCAQLGDKFIIRKWRALDEIDAGICDGMTYEEIAHKMPRIYEERKQNKWDFRWPQGESYQDLFFRVEPVILEILRHKTPLVVVAHQAVLRIIYGYLTNVNPAECPMMAFPQHAVVQLTPRAYGCDEIVHEPLLQPVAH